MEVKNWIDVGDSIYDDMVDVIQEQIRANEVRTTFNQPLLEYSINIKDFLAKAAEKAREIHASSVHYGGDPHGSVTDWENKARGRFRDNLLRMVKQVEDSALKAHFQNQIFEIWPELLPPRDLTAEEMAELCKLEEQADAILDNLKQTIQTSVEGLWEIAKAEQEIIAGTSAHNMNLIRNRTQCRLAAMAGIIGATWNVKTSNPTEPPEQIERSFMHAAPRRWADGQA